MRVHCACEKKLQGACQVHIDVREQVELKASWRKKGMNLGGKLTGHTRDQEMII
jgi:hypothetical protein